MLKVDVRAGHERRLTAQRPLLPRQRYQYHRGWMSGLALREVQQEGVRREPQGLGLQGLHVHVRGERGVIHDREPPIPASNRAASARAYRSKLHVRTSWWR